MITDHDFRCERRNGPMGERKCGGRLRYVRPWSTPEDGRAVYRCDRCKREATKHVGAELIKVREYMRAEDIAAGKPDPNDPGGEQRNPANPARAAVGGYEGAYLTEGHHDLPSVRKARSLASRAETSGEALGRGNFGTAYRLETPEGTVVVKLPTTYDMHGRKRSAEDQRGMMMHEAGIANELAEAGFGIVPATVYVELENGTPAIVREYGADPGPVTVREAADLERSLYEIERFGGVGWDVADDLLILRRADGTLFVADVGFWRKRKRERKDWHDDTDVAMLLQRWADTAPGLGEEIGAALFAGKALYDLTGGSLTRLKRDEDRDLPVVFVDTPVRGLARAVTMREAAGLPVPPEAYPILKRWIPRLLGAMRAYADKEGRELTPREVANMAMLRAYLAAHP